LKGLTYTPGAKDLLTSSKIVAKGGRGAEGGKIEVFEEVRVLAEEKGYVAYWG
jgi:hypothetical protein